MIGTTEECQIRESLQRPTANVVAVRLAGKIFRPAHVSLGGFNFATDLVHVTDRPVGQSAQPGVAYLLRHTERRLPGRASRANLVEARADEAQPEKRAPFRGGVIAGLRRLP